MNPAVEVKNVSMCYRMTNEKISTFKEYVIKKLKKEIKYTEFWALKNINFTINKGDLFGILGLNGAGKSTLLKIIAGVLKPSIGEVKVHGKIAPLLELGAGFDIELTARENIYLNGALLGFTKKEIDRKFDDIVSFSELEEFIDVPIKNFSSGMYARLGFAIATTVDPEILIVDEILSVGDFKFQQKCEKRIKEMIDKGVTVILVSHSIEQVKAMCNKGAVIEKGSLIKIGDIGEICSYYYSKYS